MGQNSIISPLFAPRAKKASAKGQSPPQELEVGGLEVGPRSGPYLLVSVILIALHSLIVYQNRDNYVSIPYII